MADKIIILMISLLLKMCLVRSISTNFKNSIQIIH